MTKKEALNTFKEFYKSVVESTDLSLKRQTWCDYVDSLCKDRQITEKQAETWYNPF